MIFYSLESDCMRFFPSAGIFNPRVNHTFFLLNSALKNLSINPNSLNFETKIAHDKFKTEMGRDSEYIYSIHRLDSMPE